MYARNMSYHRMGHLAAVLLVIKIVSLNATENGGNTIIMINICLHP